MKHRIVLFALISLGLASSTTAQRPGQQKKQKFVVVPPEQVLMTVVSQPECSIQFEEVRFLASVEGGL